MKKSSNFRLLSLIAVLTLSFFLTSCEQDEITSIAQEQQAIESAKVGVMIMPLGIANESKEKRKKYMVAATQELRDKMMENGRVAYYLMSIDKIDRVAKEMSYGDFFCDADLSSVLTEQELKGLKTYDNFEDVNTRCSSWQATGNCHWQWWGPHRMWCCGFTRDCGWKFWASESKNECS